MNVWAHTVQFGLWLVCFRVSKGSFIYFFLLVFCIDSLKSSVKNKPYTLLQDKNAYI